jgi:hypothetical protein
MAEYLEGICHCLVEVHALSLRLPDGTQQIQETQAVVNMAMNHRIPYKARNFLTT